MILLNFQPIICSVFNSLKKDFIDVLKLLLIILFIQRRLVE